MRGSRVTNRGPKGGSWRIVARVPLLFLLATCQVDKLTNTPPPLATLTLAPGQVKDSAAVGSTGMGGDSVVVTNTGSGTLSWSARLAMGGSWVAFEGPTTGTAPARLRLAFNPAGLPMGVYRDTVVVSAENAVGSPGRVPVEFMVHPCIVAPIALDAQFTDSLTTRDCAAPHRSTGFARVYRFAANANDSVSITMSSTPVDAYLLLDSTVVETAPPLALNDKCGGVGRDACVQYQRLATAGTYWLEATSAGAGQTGTFTLSVTRPRAPTDPTALGQRRSDSLTAIPLGGSTDEANVVLRGTLADPDAGDSLRLEVEVKPLGTAFDGVPTATGAQVANGHVGVVLVPALGNNTAYHWQARTRDQTGRASGWTAFGGNAEAVADFSTSIPVPPNAPTALTQFQSDGSTAIPLDGTATGRSVIFKATVTDPNLGDQLRLDVEAVPVDSPFTGAPRGSGAPVANGGTATANVAGLKDNTSYHWQARAVDQTGRVGPWVSFGGNAETAPDFRVAVAATQLAFTVQPGNAVAGVAISPAVKVSAQDALGNVVTSFTGSVTIALGNNAGGGTLSGTKTVAAVAGVATFADLSLDKVGSGYSLTASAGGLTTASAAFAITPAPAQRLVFTVQPSDAPAGAPITPAVEVTALDAFGNRATGFAGNVTVAIGTNPAGGTLAGTTTHAAVAGVATFGALSIDKAASGYKLAASATGLSGTASAAFTITPAAATRLVFTVQPTSATAGASISPAVQITAEDNLGNTVTGFAENVTVALGNNPAGGTLSGTLSRAAVGGVVSFSGLSVNKVGTGYTLTASASGTSGAVSAAFNITPGVASQLTFTVQPTSVAAGASITPAVQVTARDALGNTATGFSGNVTIAIGANPGGGSLTGTATVTATAGIASFASLAINKSGSGYALVASSGALPLATSEPFDVRPGAATSLAFTVQPASTSANATLAPPVEVTALDAFANRDTTYIGTVTVALGGPGGATLGGTKAVAAAAGVARFATLSVDKAGTGYTLAAAATGLTGATSAPFNITAGSISGTLSTLAAAPSSIVASNGTTQSTITVTAKDGSGNPIQGATVELAVSGTGNTIGQPTATDAAGVATGTLSSTKAEVKTVSAKINGTPVVQTATLTVSPAGVSATLSSLVASPATITASGGSSAATLTVTARDAFDNPIAGATTVLGVSGDGVTLTPPPDGTNNAGVASGSLSATVAGQKIVSVTINGTAITQTDTVTVTAAAANQLAFTVQPTATTAGSVITPAVQVTARDAFGNTATGFTGSVTMAIGTNPVGGVLAGTLSKAAVAGVATFGDLSINKAGAGYTLAATVTGLPQASSQAFNVAAGSGTQLVFTGQPTSDTARAILTPPVQVTAQDAIGNTITSFTGNVTLAIGNNPGGAGGGTLAGTVTVAAVGGVASFNNLSINKSGSGYTLLASTPVAGYNTASSAAFDITPGAPTKLGFATQPSNVVAGATIAPPVQVAAHDASDNLTPSFTGSVTLAIAANPGGGTLTGTVTKAAVAGVATFGDLSVNKAGSGYTLGATGSGVTGATSSGFSVTASAAAQLAITRQPAATATSGVPFGTQPQVQLRDATGNDVAQGGITITAQVATGPGGATLVNPTAVTGSTGLATFAGLAISGPAGAYTLRFTSGALTPDVSSGIALGAGAATKLVLTTEPSTTTQNDAALLQQPVVQLQDAAGNPVSQSGVVVTAAIATGAPALSGTLTATTNGNGAAAFTNLKITGAVGARTLSFGATGLAGVASTAVSVTPGAPTQIAENVGNHQTATAGTAVATPPAVIVRDVSGNPVSNVAVTFALPGTSNGALTGASQITTASGVAQVASWTLSTVAKPDTMTATSTGLAGSPVTFVDTAKVGAAATLAKFSGDNLTGQVGTTLATPHVVLVTDASGNPVSGVTMTWAAAAGGGSVNPGSSITGPDGKASTTRTLGPVPGTQTTTASATGLTTVTFSVTAQVGGASQMTINGGDRQIDTVGQTLPVPLSVLVRDNLNNPVSGVTISWSVIDGGGSVNPTSSTTNASGVASTSWTVGTAMSPTDSTQSAEATGVGSPQTFLAFTVPGAVSAAQTSVTATSPITASTGASRSTITVTARDQFGNVIKGKTVTLGATGSGNTLANPASVTDVNGVAAGTLSSTRAEVKTVTATVGPLAIAQQASITVNPDVASRLSFVGQPTSTAAGAAITPPVTVEIVDQFANRVAAATNGVTATLTNPNGAVLSGGGSVAAVGGLATFSGLSVDKAGTGYVLGAASMGLTGASSIAFNVTANAVSLSQSSVAATSPITAGGAASTITVTARDQFGNPIQGAAVELAVSGSGNTLTQPGGTTDANGVATGTLASTVAESKTVSAKINHFDVSQVATVVVNPGATASLQFTVQPSSAVAGVAMSPTVQVTARDASGNVTTGFTGPVTLTFGNNAGGGTLSGAGPITAVNGVASFANVSVDKVGTGYTLGASATGVTAATSSAFNITPAPASALFFTVQPSNAGAGATITPAVQVTARDAFGNTATGFTGQVSLAIVANPGGGTLSGGDPVVAAAGVAAFSGLSINKVGNGYTLAATAGGLASATSAAFNVTAGGATHLVFTVQPSSVVAGASIAPAMQLTALDANENVATGFAGSVSLAIGTNAGGGVLSGGGPVTAANGVASFPGASIDKVGNGYTLTAASAGVTGAISGTFNVSPASASALVFTVQPSNVTAGEDMTPAVQVTARDPFGNTASGFAGNVSLAIATNPGGASLSGGGPVAAIGGIATFSAVRLDKAGSGYTLGASATGLTGAASTGFNVAPAAATALFFTVQPGNTLAGASLAPVPQVTARDQFANTDTAYAGAVTVTISTNPGGGTLTGTTTVAAAHGVATFSTLSIDKVGTGYQLGASATSLGGATSAAFNITPAAATQLAFGQQPTGATAGVAISPAITVRALDGSGNVATGFTGTVSIAIANNAGGGTLAGTTAVAAVAGVATFSGLSIDKAGTGYTLTATGAGSTTSTAFNITAGTATQLVFSVQPSTTVAGAAITPAVQVTAQDAQGNTATGFTGTITVAIGTNPSSGTLSGTKTVAAVAGVAAFSGLSVDRVGTGYTLTATGAGSATSTAFNITAGTATQLVFSVQPSTTVAGAAITPAVQVTAQDAQGNTATGFTGTITVAIGTNPSSGTLSGTKSVAAVAGVATFSGLSIDKAGTGYTLTATGAGAATSTAFNITAGTATQVVFSVQPSTTAAGAAITPAVQVTAQDAQGNTATGFTGDVTVAIGTNPSTGTLSGTKVVAAVAGVATFSTLSIDKVGTGYTLTATGVGTATSAAFNITAGTATQLVFTAQPSATTAGAPITPAVQVTAQDAQGNTATGFAGNVTVALGANPGGGTLSGTTTLAAVNGVATFGNLSIDKAGVGYTLTAGASGRGGATSNAFNVTPASATKLVFTGQPSTTVAGAAITPAVQVTAQDALGNTATLFTGPVTLALGNNPGGGSLAGTTTVNAVSGVATFANLSIAKAGTGYTLTATTTGFSATASAAFNITPGAASQLVFTVQPTNTAAGAAITPAVQVTAQDAQGNTATGFAGNVSVALGANPGGGTLSGTTTVAASNGVATFANLAINKTGTDYTLTATGAGTATSTAFNITAGTATQLVFSVQPSNTTSGAAITPAVQVTAQDAQGNTATSFTGNVTVALGTNPGSGTLSGTTTVTAVAGVATFSDLSVNKSANGYTLTAATTGLSPVTSAAFNVTPGTAVQLVFGVQPSNATAGASITPAVQVTAQDAQGNTATGFTGNVTAAIGTNPGGGTLSGTTTVAAVNGVATFTNLSINKVGAGYTLSATASGVTTAASAAFNIAAGAASQLVLSVQPSNTTAGVAITPPVQVTAQDAQGNTATGFTGTVTVTLGTNPGGGTLSGTTAVAAVNGVATFTNLSINKVGSGYTLAASATGVTGATSAGFTITPGSARQLVFTVQPTNAAAGASITPAVQVTAEDGFGNTDPTFTANVTVALGANPGGGTLSGTTSVAAASGVATFPGLSVDKVGVGYTLTANAIDLTGSTSATFNVTAGAAAILAFTVEPSNATATLAITPAVRVTAQDAQGNTATGFTGTVTVAIGTNPDGGVLAGTTSVAAVAGVATFSNLNINKVGTGYTLTAASTGPSGATSTPFDVTAGVATHLTFAVQPTTTPANAVITPPIQVSALDAGNNVATGFSGNIAMAITPTSPSGTLSGSTTVAAVAGVATFSDLSINNPNTGYRLRATSSGLTNATSASFNITAVTNLVFTAQPSNIAAGGTITPAVQVTAEDAAGRIGTGFTGNVTVAIGTNPGGGALSGTTTVAAVGGVATFSTLSINKAGIGYTITAVATGLTTATSSTFNVSAGGATQLTFVAQPSNTTAGTAIAPAVQLAAQDAQGNTDPSFTGNVTVALGTNPGGGTLSGTTTVAAVNGVATFSTLSINKVGSGYTIAASASGLTGRSSTAFNITAAAAAQLVFTVQPSSATSGAALTPAVQVTAQDAQGNTATGFTGSITVAIASNPGGGTLAGTTSVAAVNGVATFATLSINKVGTGYTLAASATGPSGTTSAAFNITAGTATQLVFSVEPSNTTAGAAITPSVQVTAQDASGNTATGFTGNVTVAIGANPSSGTLSGTKTVAAVAGVAAFSGLSIDKAGTGYTLSATGAGSATSAAFNITAGTATALIFSVQPTNTAAATAITPAVEVTAQDASGNTATGFTGNVTVAIGTNPSGGALSGTLTHAAVAGVATFSGLSIDKAGTGYTLTATGAGTATSTAFTITAGAATQLVFNVQPSTTAAGAAITPAVQVTAQDAQGNTATGFTGDLTVAIGTNPSSGTLSGTKTVAAVAGVATFSGLSIDKAGTGYTLTATGAGTATSTAFTITAGTATQLVFSVEPSNTTAGAPITPSVQVTAQDASGNTATGFTGNVTVAIGTNPSGGALSGTLTHAAVGGVATFAGLSIDKAGTGYTLTATGAGTATSTAFTITAGTATQLVFSVEPSNTTAGAPITPAVQVTAQDASGNTATGFTGNVTVALGTNPSGGALSGTLTHAAVGGVATFAGLSIDKAGTGYTVSATGAGSATSAGFNITAGTATQLVFSVEPSNTTAGAPITPAVQVTAQDASGNTATGFTGNVTVAIGANPSSGTLSGTKTVAAVAGVAAFSGLSIDKAGTGYTLSATGAGSATSTTFNITAGTATQLVFSVQPSTTAAGAAITPAVQVTAQDAQGNTATGFTGDLTVAIGTNPSSGTLSGTKTVAAVAGVATFAGLSIDKAGTGYTLTATGAGSTTSAAFAITAGAATALVFSVQPTSTAAGTAITPAVEVTAQDASGNTATGFTGNITVAIGTNPNNGTLAGTKTVAAVAGMATFSGLSIDKAGTGYTLTATGAGSATSATFNITAGTATALVFSVQPSNTVAGAEITPAVQVTALDANDNTATGFSGDVTVAIGTNAAGGTLSGTRIHAAVNGVATFPGLSIDKAGTGYTLTATGAGSTTSAAFNITAGAAATIAINAGDGQTATVGTPVQVPPSVIVRDQFGNPVPGVGVSFVPAAGSGNVVPTTAVATDGGGVAALTSWTLGTTAGTDHLTATATGNGITGNPVTFTATATADAPSANQSQVAAAPGTITVSNGSSASTITVTVRDAQGNSIQGATVALAASGTGNSLTQPAGTTDGSGIATGTLSSTTAETKTVTATVNGSLAITQTATITVDPAATATSIAGHTPNPSTFGDAIAVTFSVTSSGGTPTGNVTVTDGAATCTATVVQGGCSVTPTSAGAKTLTATYAGDGNFAGSTSLGVSQTVNQAATSTTITSVSSEPATVGQSTTVSFSVASSAGTPTGNVTVSDGTDSCVGTVAAGSCALTSTTAGAKTLTATYGGDGNFAGSSSVGVSHTVDKGATTTTITSVTPEPSTVSQAVTVFFNVTSGTGSPTGTVTVSDGGVNGCTGAVADGSCSFTPLLPGDETLIATYSGDANFQGSTSTPVVHTVNAPLGPASSR